MSDEGNYLKKRALNTPPKKQGVQPEYKLLHGVCLVDSEKMQNLRDAIENLAREYNQAFDCGSFGLIVMSKVFQLMLNKGSTHEQIERLCEDAHIIAVFANEFKKRDQ